MRSLLVAAFFALAVPAVAHAASPFGRIQGPQVSRSGEIRMVNGDMVLIGSARTKTGVQTYQVQARSMRARDIANIIAKHAGSENLKGKSWNIAGHLGVSITTDGPQPTIFAEDIRTQRAK